MGSSAGGRHDRLRGMTVGDDAIVGAGSVVVAVVPPRVMAAGNPAGSFASSERADRASAEPDATGLDDRVGSALIERALEAGLEAATPVTGAAAARADAAATAALL